jgi:hypothetical protein
MGGQANADLERALRLSHEMAAAADQGKFEELAELDAERLQLLKSFRTGNGRIDATDQSLLNEISRLNDRAIGLMEHHRRIKGREMDLAAVGRRAVSAYSTTRLSR